MWTIFDRGKIISLSVKKVAKVNFEYLFSLSIHEPVINLFRSSSSDLNFICIITYEVILLDKSSSPNYYMPHHWRHVILNGNKWPSQPAQLHRLASHINFNLRKFFFFCYHILTSKQKWRWSDCASAQSDQRHCCFHVTYTGLELRVHNKNVTFLFLNQNICCGYSKEPSQWDGSFEHP